LAQGFLSGHGTLFAEAAVGQLKWTLMGAGRVVLAQIVEFYQGTTKYPAIEKGWGLAISVVI